MCDNDKHLILINHLLLIFKFYIYSARNTKQLNFDNLKKKIKKIKELEKEQTVSNKMKLSKKWRPIDHITNWYFFQSEKEGRMFVLHFISHLFLFAFFSLFSIFQTPGASRKGPIK